MIDYGSWVGFATQLVTLASAVAAVAASLRNRKSIQQISIRMDGRMDGRMDELLELTRISSEAKGKAQEVADQIVRDDAKRNI